MAYSVCYYRNGEQGQLTAIILVYIVQNQNIIACPFCFDSPLFHCDIAIDRGRFPIGYGATSCSLNAITQIREASILNEKHQKEEKEAFPSKEDEKTAYARTIPCKIVLLIDYFVRTVLQSNTDKIFAKRPLVFDRQREGVLQAHFNSFIEQAEVLVVCKHVVECLSKGVVWQEQKDPFQCVSQTEKVKSGCAEDEDGEKSSKAGDDIEDGQSNKRSRRHSEQKR